MAARTDEELLDVVRGPHEDWEPEARDAAQAELARRGVDLGSQPYRGLDAKDLPAPRRRAPLGADMKFVGLVLGATLSALGVFFALGIMSTWKRRGDPRDGGQLVMYALAGAAVSLLLIGTIRC
jgi:hypothetical protein